MSALLDIEIATRFYAEKLTVLEERVQHLNDEQTAILRRLLPGIKSAVAACTAAKEELKTLIDNNRDAFDSPRTRQFHGIKVGLAKGKGAAEIESEEKVIELIEKKLEPERAELLIETEKKLLKKNLRNLDDAELKKIGVSFADAGDYIVIKPVDSEVEKAVKALLKDGAEEAEAARREAA